MRWQTSQDSLDWIFWRRSALLNFPLFIEKVISTKVTLRNVKKTGNANLLVEFDSHKHAENILKMKTFHAKKSKVYPHEKLNTSKGVIGSKDLSLATAREITAALGGKKGVTDYKIIIIKKGGEKIWTNTYSLMFNQPQIPKEVKIGYCLEKVERYIWAPQ